MASISGSLFQGDAILLRLTSRKERSPLNVTSLVWSVQLVFAHLPQMLPRTSEGGGLVGLVEWGLRAEVGSGQGRPRPSISLP